MRKLVRVGDHVRGRCEVNAPGHPRDCTGTWTSGSTVVFGSNGQGIVRVSDHGITDCNHQFTANKGSDTVEVSMYAVLREGDVAPIDGGGTVICISGDDTITCE